MITANDALDRRTYALGKAVFNLRQDIDIHRIIGLNVTVMRDAHVSEAFFGHVQRVAHISIAIAFCKIYEYSSRHQLSSIPALISALPQSREASVDLYRVKEYAEIFGGSISSPSSIKVIHSTFEAFKGSHTDALRTLRLFRDKFAAHLEDTPQPTTLPSHEQFEALWDFANETYRVIHNEFNRVGPAFMKRSVGSGLIKTLKELGVPNPIRDFPK